MYRLSDDMIDKLPPDYDPFEVRNLMSMCVQHENLEVSILISMPILRLFLDLSKLRPEPDYLCNSLILSFIAVSGSNQTSENGTSSANEHLFETGDRQDAESNNPSQANIERFEASHRWYDYHVREPERCSRLYVRRQSPQLMEQGMCVPIFTFRKVNVRFTLSMLSNTFLLLCFCVFCFCNFVFTILYYECWFY